MLRPSAQLREHERAADERRGFDAQDAVAEMREAEARRPQRRAFRFREAALRSDREHRRLRRRGKFRRAGRFVRIERDLPRVGRDERDGFGERTDARHFGHERRAGLFGSLEDMLAPFAVLPERAREIARVAFRRLEEDDARRAEAREVVQDFLRGLRTREPDEHREGQARLWRFFPGDGERELRRERGDRRDAAQAVLDADVERTADGESDRLAQVTGARVIGRESGLAASSGVISTKFTSTKVSRATSTGEREGR